MNDKWKTAMTILDFLFKHGHEVNTPDKWADLIGFDIIDADGWTRESFKVPVTLAAFVERVGHATIGPLREAVSLTPAMDAALKSIKTM